MRLASGHELLREALCIRLLPAHGRPRVDVVTVELDERVDEVAPDRLGAQKHRKLGEA